MESHSQQTVESIQSKADAVMNAVEEDFKRIDATFEEIDTSVGTGVRMLVSSGRDFNLGRATDTLDRLIRRRYKLKYFVTMGLFSKSDQHPLGHTL